MPLRKEPPTPRSAAVNARLDSNNDVGPSRSGLAPLIPFKPGQTSLRKQAILTEEEYTCALSSIIKRDFFPDLDRITAENEYLAAVEAEEPARIRIALDRLLRLDGRTNASPAPQRASKRSRNHLSRASAAARNDSGEWDNTPIAFGSSSEVFDPTFTPAESTIWLDHQGEPQHEAEAEAAPASGIHPDLDLSLAHFQSRYTSEDNASFSQLLDRDNELRKRKHAHLFAHEAASGKRRQQLIDAERRDAERGKRLMLEASPDDSNMSEEATEMLLIEGSDAKVEEKSATAAAVTVTGQRPETSSEKDPMDDLVLVCEPRQDDRRTASGLHRWKYTARNALMFGADANESYLHARPLGVTADHEASRPQTNFTALRLGEQSNSHTAARHVDAPQSEAGWCASTSRLDAAIQRGRAGSFTSPVASASGDETPKVNGYGFVTPYSTPQSGNSQSVDGEMHLRVYNAIKRSRQHHVTASTSIDDIAARACGFQLPRLDKREQLAEKLTSTPKLKRAAERASTPYGQARYTGLTRLRTSAFGRSPQKMRDKVGGLTPAAKALLDRSTRGLTPASARQRVASPIASQRHDANTAKSLGDRSWTPTPQRTRH